MKSLLSGSFWLVLAGGLGQGSTLISSLLVANLLGVASYGHYALVQSTVGLLAGLAQMGFAVIIAQQVSSYREGRSELIGEMALFCYAMTFVLSALFAAALFFGRDVLSNSVFRDSELAPGLIVAAIALPFVAGATLQQGLFSGLERFRDQATISVVLVPLVIALPVLGAFQMHFVGAAIGLAIAYVLRFCLSQAVINRHFRRNGLTWSMGGFRARFPIIWRLALPATLSGILVVLAMWGGQTLLVRSDGGAAGLGLFAAAYLVKTVVLFAPSQMTVALLPILSRQHSSQAGSHRGRLVWANTAVTLFLTVAVAAVGIFAAPFIMGLFGPEFVVGSSVLVILLVSAPIEAITMSLYQDLPAQGRYWTALLSVSLPLATTVLVIAAFVTRTSQGEGLAVAWLVGWIVALAGTLLARTAGRGGDRGDRVQSPD